MRDRPLTSRNVLLSLVALIGIPFVGFMLLNRPLSPLLEFPPASITVEHAPFSWAVFGLGAIIVAGLMTGLGILLFSGSPIAPNQKPTPGSPRFPWWGWLSLTLLLVFWILAWTRFSWFADFQDLTFTPLWLSFIVLVNALAYHRTGQCLLVHQPRFFLSLFLWSAIFWWYFEYLNRFVQNWRYIGLEPMTATYYAVHSTVAFSTVLPAVFSTCHLLQTFSVFSRRGPAAPLFLVRTRPTAWTLLGISSVCLLGLGIWPNYLFPCVWIAPLLLLLGIQFGWGRSTVLVGLQDGRWQMITIPACAALLCGFFWELWNFYSAAKWVYSIPFVDRFHLFEMPLLGYAGYLPFGLECLVAVDLVAKGRHFFDFIGWSSRRG